MDSKSKYTVDFSPELINKIARAIYDVKDGECEKVIIGKNTKVYKCANIVRIDLKIVEEE